MTAPGCSVGAGIGGGDGSEHDKAGPSGVSSGLGPQQRRKRKQGVRSKAEGEKDKGLIEQKPTELSKVIKDEPGENPQLCDGFLMKVSDNGNKLKNPDSSGFSGDGTGDVGSGNGAGPSGLGSQSRNIKRTVQTKTEGFERLTKKPNVLSGSVDTTGTDEPESEIPQFSEGFLNVFGNDLIFRKVASYLNFHDLTNLRRSCSFVSKELQSFPEYLGRCKLVIGDQIAGKYLLKSSVNWKHATLDLNLHRQLKKEKLNGIKQAVSKTDSLAVRQSNSIPILEEDAAIVIFNQQFEEIISSIQGIHSLDIEWTVIGTEIPLFSQQKASDVPALRSVSNLHISSGNEAAKENPFSFARPLKIESMIKNLKFWTNPDIKLRTLKFDFYSLFNFRVLLNPTDRFKETIIQLMEQHKGTLENIKVYSILFKPSQLSQLVLPKLAKLEISYKSRDWEAVKSFLKAQPLLQFLKITLNRKIEFPIFQLITERSAGLKGLSIKFKRFYEWNPTSLDWTFLQNLSGFEEFRLVLQRPHWNYTSNIHAIDILRVLPSSIKNLYLNGLDAIYQDQDLLTESLIIQFSKMTDLRELSLLSCKNLVTNDLLHFICSNVNGLRVLEFSESSFVTNFGITGISANRNLTQRSGLSSLKGLERLLIASCAQLQVSDVLQAAKFLELSQLEILSLPNPRNENETIDQNLNLLLELAKNNPNLQFLTCEWDFIGKRRGNRCVSRAVLEDKIKQILPRFKTLKTEVPDSDDTDMSDLNDDNGSDGD